MHDPLVNTRGFRGLTHHTNKRISEGANGDVLQKKVFLKFCKIHRKAPVPESPF